MGLVWKPGAVISRIRLLFYEELATCDLIAQFAKIIFFSLFIWYLEIKYNPNYVLEDRMIGNQRLLYRKYDHIPQ